MVVASESNIDSDSEEARAFRTVGNVQVLKSGMAAQSACESGKV